MIIVVKVSGHLLSPEPGVINDKYIAGIASVIRKLCEDEHKVVAVTGGGLVARAYISAARRIGLSEAINDLIGIGVTRLNAQLLIYALQPYAYPEVPRTIADVIRMLGVKPAVVLGGLQPGQSTTAVAALCAEALSADYLVITTNVDGIYTADPRKDPSARKLDVVRIDELEKYVQVDSRAGKYALFDRLSMEIIKRSRIKTVVLNGDPPDNILKFLKGEKVGTLITHA